MGVAGRRWGLDTEARLATLAGLAEPWASRGQTPLELSFCQHVVTADAPLVVTDGIRQRLRDAATGTR